MDRLETGIGDSVMDVQTMRLTASDKYTMRISRLTIDKLGIQLYDRVAAVLAELVANSYDADATNVTVRLPWGVFLAEKDGSSSSPEYQIIVEDDGHGMTPDEVNLHYLTVGADRRARTNSDKSRGLDRPVMGRKGIGKLAPFGICRTIEVITCGGSDDQRTDEGWPVSHLVLRLEDVLSDTEAEYHPQPGDLDDTYARERGTRIVLRDFARKRVPSKDELDRQLGARFGLEREDWKVTVVDASSVVEEADSFILGELKVDVLSETKIDVSSRPVTLDDGTMLPVTGWVAYSKQPYRDESMAGVRIFARGKLVAQTRDFGIGAGFTGEFKLRSYLIGSIHAEWLDEADDLVRSDRQDIIWSSDLGEALASWGRELIKELAKMGEDSVKKQTWDEFLAVSDLEARLTAEAPADKDFRDSVRSAARILVSNKDRAAISDKDHVERVVQLAFSLGPQRSLLESLREAAEGASNTFETLVSLFDKARIAEVYSLGQVARDRMDVVERLESLTSDGGTLEAPFQELIEGAPWLLAPEWTPLGMNESLQRVRTQFEAWYKMKYAKEIVTTAIGTPRREPDFVLLNDAGVLWIVEIKRMDHHLTDEEYLRAVNYLKALDEFLDANPELAKEFPDRRLTFVVDHIDKLSAVSESSLSSDSRVDRKTWNELLSNTKRAHKDFLAHVRGMQSGSADAAPSA